MHMENQEHKAITLKDAIDEIQEVAQGFSGKNMDKYNLVLGMTPIITTTLVREILSRVPDPPNVEGIDAHLEYELRKITGLMPIARGEIYREFEKMRARIEIIRKAIAGGGPIDSPFVPNVDKAVDLIDELLVKHRVMGPTDELHEIRNLLTDSK